MSKLCTWHWDEYCDNLIIKYCENWSIVLTQHFMKQYFSENQSYTWKSVVTSINKIGISCTFHELIMQGIFRKIQKCIGKKTYLLNFKMNFEMSMLWNIKVGMIQAYHKPKLFGPILYFVTPPPPPPKKKKKKKKKTNFPSR